MLGINGPINDQDTSFQSWGGFFFFFLVIVLPKSHNITLHFDCVKYLLSAFHVYYFSHSSKKKSIEVMGQVLLFPVFQIKKGGLREFEQFALLGKEKKTHQFYFFLREYCMLDFEPVHLFVPYQAL